MILDDEIKRVRKEIMYLQEKLEEGKRAELELEKLLIITGEIMLKEQELGVLLRRKNGV